MSKTEKDILKNLQDKSNAFELPVEDFVWDNIEKEISPKPSKKPFLNWKKGGVILLLIAAIGLGVYFISGESQQLVKTQRIGGLKHPTTKIDLGFVAKEKYAILSILNDKGEDKRQLQSSLSGQMNSYFEQAPSMVSIQEINYPSYDLGLQNNQPEKLGNNKGTPTKINNKNKSGLNVYHNDTDLVMVNGQGGINLNDSGSIGTGISTTKQFITYN